MNVLPVVVLELISLDRRDVLEYLCFLCECKIVLGFFNLYAYIKYVAFIE